MSIAGITFCDHCGGAIGLDDLAPVKMEEGGHLVQLHLHNRHENDCLGQKLDALAELFATEPVAVER